MKLHRKIYWFLFLLSSLSAQITATQRDSLWEVWNNSRLPDTSRLQALETLIREVYLYSNPDSAILLAQAEYAFAKSKRLLKYIGQAYNFMGIAYWFQGNSKKTIHYFEKSLEIFTQNKDYSGIGNALNNLGIVYYNQGNWKKAIAYYSKSLEIQKKIKYHEGIANALLNIGNIYYTQGDLVQAENYYLESLRYVRKNNLLPQMARNYNNLGNLYLAQGKLEKAIEHYSRSLETYKKLGNKQGMASVLGNIAGLYKQQKDYKQAMESYLQAMQIGEELGDKRLVADHWSGIGTLYSLEKKYDKALEAYDKSLKLYKEVKYPDGEVFVLFNIGDIYLTKGDLAQAKKYFEKSLPIAKQISDKNAMALIFLGLGKVSMQQHNLSEAVRLARKSLKLSRETGDIDNIRLASEVLYRIYKKLGDSDRALAMYELYIRMRDSLQNEQNIKATARLQAKLEYEKEREIEEAKHKAELEQQKLRVQKQKIVLISVSSLLGLLFIFLFLLFNRYKVIKQKNKIILTQNVELEQQKEELQAINEALKAKHEEVLQQSEELKRLNELLTEQKQQIESKNRNIIASIEYAYRLQKTLIEASDVFRQNLPPHFLIFLPKDIVSGDFYWIYKTPNYAYAAVADCTGHGVPGALISILGMEFLNQIMEKHEEPPPDFVLNLLREKFVERFHSKHSQEVHRDGMDISLIRMQGQNIEFAAANNPLYILTRNKEHYPSEFITSEFSEDNETYILQINADRKSIGYSEELTPFSLKKLNVHPQDEIFLLSDGFPDQFGGKKHKKLKRKNLKRLLLQLYDIPVNEQEVFLRNFLTRWKGDAKQTDDITVMGIRIS